jgi:hypothetical protein
MRRPGVEVEIEHTPAPVRRLAHDELVPGAIGSAVNHWFFHWRSFVGLVSVRLPRAGEIGGLLKPGGDREQRTRLLGEQPRQRSLHSSAINVAAACSSAPAASSSAPALRANSRSTVRSAASVARARPARSAASCW